MSKPVCVKDYENSAKLKLDKRAWKYYSGGTGQEQTLNDNCEAFKRYRLRPRVLNDVSSVDMTTKVLGSTLSFPVCVAPTAMNKLAHRDGEIAVAKVAGALGTGFVFSTFATTNVEDVNTYAANTIKWMQLYIFKDRKFTEDLVKRAEQNGFTGLFVTVDSSGRDKSIGSKKGSFKLPPHLRMKHRLVEAYFEFRLENLVGSGHLYMESKLHNESQGDLAYHLLTMLDASLDWSDVEWLKSITSLPVVLKGILTGEMAELAVKHKVDGIVVSNHGGRQLDGVPATIDALSEVVKAVNGRIEVYVDGGIRTGTDVLKAIALGAKTVFVGRPVLWALAYNGEEGVKEMLTILKQEFKTAMQLMGFASIADLQRGKDLVVHESYYKAYS